MIAKTRSLFQIQPRDFQNVHRLNPRALTPAYLLMLSQEWVYAWTKEPVKKEVVNLMKNGVKVVLLNQKSKTCVHCGKHLHRMKCRHIGKQLSICPTCYRHYLHTLHIITRRMIPLTNSKGNSGPVSVPVSRSTYSVLDAVRTWFQLKDPEHDSGGRKGRAG